MVPYKEVKRTMTTITPIEVVLAVLFGIGATGTYMKFILYFAEKKDFKHEWADSITLVLLIPAMLVGWVLIDVENDKIQNYAAIILGIIAFGSLFLIVMNPGMLPETPEPRGIETNLSELGCGKLKNQANYSTCHETWGFEDHIKACKVTENDFITSCKVFHIKRINGTIYFKEKVS